ncbi:TfoX/Sxy family protein [Marisediminicola senii]|uniref:TfoX/Sxy family protein n=1 Tax=Marisediminicola senii TaxID=2711233 RepID=UPI001913B769|nr:TfoX/Sxy family protein [Marisediminicola senii]
MTSDQRIVDFIVAQMTDAGNISTRKMFGEHAIWCDGKTVAVIANDQLYVKITPEGRQLAAGAEEAPAYPGAKPSLLVAPERWEDASWLATLIRTTANALPAPRPRKH